MAIENEKKITTFKAYHIVLIACLLSPLLILNSNYVNDKRAKLKLEEQKSKLFDVKVLGRNLEGEEENELKGSDKVCKKGSEDLVQYYKTGDLKKIGLDNNPIKAEDKDEPYFKSLINLIKKLTKSENEIESEGEGRLRNLQSLNGMEDDLMNYGKHILPIVAFLVIAILAIPGWIICCFCCCCNCCCCCCCKKPGCKIPCFLFTNIFYALAVAICIYGLSQSNNVFKGMASTECSLLKFFDQFLDGETKSEPPRWAGIDPINRILDGMAEQITDLKDHTKSQLDNQFDNIFGNDVKHIDGSKKTFKAKMNAAGEKFFTLGNYDTRYKKDCSSYTSASLPDYFVLDLVKKFGRHTGSDNYDGIYTENTILSAWQTECTRISSSADTNLQNAHSGFNEILDSSSDLIIRSLNDGQNILGELKGSFNDIKSLIADTIIDSSETIDEYGKLGFKVAFGVLALINIAMAAFILLLCFFSGKVCTNSCCCCRCLFKCATHLLWNILALLMIITFLLGFFLALIGQIGSDVMSIISFIVSEDNLRATEGSILVDSLGESKGYLDRCIIGDGKIEEQIGLGTAQINSFDQIYTAENAISQAKGTFQQIQRNLPTYNIFKDELNDRTLLKNKLNLMSITRDSGTNSVLNFDIILREMNESIANLDSSPNNQEKWVIGSPSDNTCGSGSNDDTITPEGNKIFNPLKCSPNQRDWINALDATTSIKKTATVLTHTLDLVKDASDETNADSFLGILNSLKDDYKNIYLQAYIDTLDLFQTSIQRITSQLRQYTGNNNGLFSFIKCSFIGTNLKIMLKYLKSALGGDVKTIGICLLVVGCSLALSISATILMIIIINLDVENNKKKGQVDSQGRVIQFK